LFYGRDKRETEDYARGEGEDKGDKEDKEDTQFRPKRKTNNQPITIKIGSRLVKRYKSLENWMSSEPVEQASVENTDSPLESEKLLLADPQLQVRLARLDGQLQAILPDAQKRPAQHDWLEIWQQLKHRLNSGERFWQPGETVHVLAQDQLLDNRQLQEIAAALQEATLKIERVYTSRRQTAVTAAAAGYSVEQQSPNITPIFPTATAESACEPPLYLKSTQRSGIEVRHPGTVVVLGDVNPGSKIVAAKDVLVFGRLRGIAHAGANGDRVCIIAALQMEATQLRIADTLARVPEHPSGQFEPEIAFIAPGGIQIAQASYFFKAHCFDAQANAWVEADPQPLTNY
jgi:septum site-determining protein MinC